MIWRIPISFLSFFLPLAALGHGLAPQPPADEDRKIVFPDVEGYLTLVFDPHTHSVFSDGHVWPNLPGGLLSYHQ